MKFTDIKPDMKLVATGDYGGCIVPGDKFVAYKHPETGELHISCRGPDGAKPTGSCHHELKPMVWKRGEIPELEPVAG